MTSSDHHLQLRNAASFDYARWVACLANQKFFEPAAIPRLRQRMAAAERDFYHHRDAHQAALRREGAMITLYEKYP